MEKVFLAQYFSPNCTTINEHSYLFSNRKIPSFHSDITKMRLLHAYCIHSLNFTSIVTIFFNFCWTINFVGFKLVFVSLKILTRPCPFLSRFGRRRRLTCFAGAVKKWDKHECLLNKRWKEWTHLWQHADVLVTTMHTTMVWIKSSQIYLHFTARRHQIRHEDRLHPG